MLIMAAKHAPAARMLARPCVRVAMVSRPLGPWYTAYMAAMLASSACMVKSAQPQLLHSASESLKSGVLLI